MMVVAFAAFAIGLTLYFALGMPGMDMSSGSTMDGMDMGSEAPTHRLVDPVAFAAAMNAPGAIVINVHTPYDGEIEGTDLFIPFDEIDAVSLPAAKNTPLVVYCRSGSMSAEAVSTLSRLGYTNIVELDGGMNAWRSNGGPVVMNSSGN